MLSTLFLLFVGGAFCFFIGEAIGHGLAAHHAPIVTALIMGAIWAGYLYKYKDTPKSTLATFLEFIVSTVIGGFIVVILGWGYP